MIYANFSKKKSKGIERNILMDVLYMVGEIKGH